MGTGIAATGTGFSATGAGWQRDGTGTDVCGSGTGAVLKNRSRAKHYFEHLLQ